MFLRASLIILNILLCLNLGCAPKPEPKLSVNEAQKKFEAKCREDFDMHVITRLVGNTFWIYYPTKEPLFDYESHQENSAEATKKPNKFTVQYVDGNYKDRRFTFEYDIIEKKKSKTDDPGFNSSYSGSYNKAYNNLNNAIINAFTDSVNEQKQPAPKFIVIVITDIKKGIETRATFYLEDFKRVLTNDLPYDEYMKRYLADTKGGQSMIGDETGSHIQYKDIEMPEFLTKQILNRINFKFQRSDSQPDSDFDSTIVGIVADTTRYYHFKDFASVQLTNLRSNKKLIFESNQLTHFGDDPENKQSASEGRLIHIQFENGEAKISE